MHRPLVNAFAHNGAADDDEFYRCRGKSGKAWAGIVTVARPMDWLHETIHFLLEREMGKDPAWDAGGNDNISF